MLVIRLMKTGKKGESKFRLVVKERRDRRDGKALEYLGIYEKRVGGTEVKTLDMDRIKHWVKMGAQMTPTAKKIAGL